MTAIQYKEENNYPKAFAATGVILAVILALFYFIVFQNPVKQDDGTGGILVNYGTTDEGMGNDITSVEQPSVSLKANHTAPTKVTPVSPTEDKTVEDKSDRKVVTQNDEDAPVVDSKSKKSTAVVVTQPTKAAPKQVVNTAAMYKGPNKSNGTGGGDGTTNTPGNQGSPNGSALSDNYGPGGSGNGLNLPHWNYVNPPDVKNVHRTPGIVIIDFMIDQNGNVLQATSNRKSRAGGDLIDGCIEAIKRTKFTSSAPASGNQKGQYTFIFKVD